MKTILTTCAMLVPICADPGMTIEGVPDKLAGQLVALGNAVIVADEGGEEPQVLDPIQKISDAYAEVLIAGPESFEDRIDRIEAICDGYEPEEEMKRPYGNSTKAAWIKWALHSDPKLTREAAENMSKVQLMSVYGERLLRLKSPEP